MGTSMEQEQWAIFLAAICGQTYTQFTNTDGSFVLPLRYSLHDTIEANSLIGVAERFGFILESPDEIIIAFRGTLSTTDWISDAIASQKNFKYIKEPSLTHRGFTNIYASTRGQIMSALNRLPHDKTLYITGHSLGGALATLCAVDIAANTDHTTPYVFTYGSPRVGDPDFAMAYTKYVRSSFRIANLFDVVTHAPPHIYKVPKREKKYYYSHVHTHNPLNFQNGSVSANHVIGSYFAELTKLQPQFAELLCSTNPGFCPAVETPIEKV
ncbi:triacylglycerol lipase [Paenibacillus sp. LBL]|uniref:lipase family protein n=1 Tax=Paenibacillus sp. LBL TaxID=2940563 RepID=UPI0024744973|nr:lipase family protein [Paenibacillus sp. LBL]MDH6669798.1 triacylglycerol lipase [Paenibacillus sp. LBL]